MQRKIREVNKLIFVDDSPYNDTGPLPFLHGYEKCIWMVRRIKATLASHASIVNLQSTIRTWYISNLPNLSLLERKVGAQKWYVRMVIWMCELCVY